MLFFSSPVLPTGASFLHLCGNGSASCSHGAGEDLLQLVWIQGSKCLDVLLKLCRLDVKCCCALESCHQSLSLATAVILRPSCLPISAMACDVIGVGSVADAVDGCHIRSEADGEHLGDHCHPLICFFSFLRSWIPDLCPDCCQEHICIAPLIPASVLDPLCRIVILLSNRPGSIRKCWA